MTENMRSYYAAREQAERQAAVNESRAKIRRIHLTLAERYARLAEPRRELSLSF